MDNIAISGAQPGTEAQALGGQVMPPEDVITREQLQEFSRVLHEYKVGKASTERRMIAAEQWWKLHNQPEEEKAGNQMYRGFRSRSSWLHNVIVNKHADAVESYPEPNILPREEGDKQEAKMLSAIVPCVLEQNAFDATWSDAMWAKMKYGTCVYKITWDSSKLGGLGDISIERVNVLNLFWEPGITDIQKSRYVYHTELMDNDALEEQYPQLRGQLKGNDFYASKFLYDDNVPTDRKSTVIDVYYHRGGVLHYCKYIGDIVLYATENDPEYRERGLYDHGLYPYVFDALFPVEGSPCGYGYVDICRNPQTAIDSLGTSLVRNAVVGATPRYFMREDGSVNEQELLDTEKPLVHVDGNLGQDSIRPIDYNALPGNYINVWSTMVNELRETSGNTDTATGNVTSGVTAASAIAALQEASGKGSRDSTLAAYRAYSQIVNLCIELIRQFYDLPRSFRIVGELGMEQFVSYSNQGLQPQAQGMAFGADMGMRLPVFDIKVSAQKKNVYTRVSQNELALQFFQMGFFNPSMTDQALACLDMMDFDGKDGVMQKIQLNGVLAQRLQQYQQLALSLAQIARPDMVQGIAADMGIAMPAQASAGASAAPKMQESDEISGIKADEHPIAAKAREASANAAQPGGGAVVKGGSKA